MRVDAGELVDLEFGWRSLKKSDFPLSGGDPGVLLERLGVDTTFKPYLFPGEKVEVTFRSVKPAFPVSSKACLIMMLLSCVMSLCGIIWSRIRGIPGPRSAGEVSLFGFTSRGRALRITHTDPLGASLLPGPRTVVSAWSIGDACYVRRCFREGAVVFSDGKQGHVRVFLKRFPATEDELAREAACQGTVSRWARRNFKWNRVMWEQEAGSHDDMAAKMSKAVQDLLVTLKDLFKRSVWKRLVFYISKLVGQILMGKNPAGAGQDLAGFDEPGTFLMSFYGADAFEESARFEAEVIRRAAAERVFTATADSHTFDLASDESGPTFKADAKGVVSIPRGGSRLSLAPDEVVLTAFPNHPRLSGIDYLEVFVSLGWHFFEYILPAKRSRGATVVTDRRVMILCEEGAMGKRYRYVSFSFLCKGYTGTTLMQTGEGLGMPCTGKAATKKMSITSTHGAVTLRLPRVGPAASGERSRQLFGLLTSARVPAVFPSSLPVVGDNKGAAPIPVSLFLPGEAVVVAMPSRATPLPKSIFGLNLNPLDMRAMVEFGSASLTTHRTMFVKGVIQDKSAKPLGFRSAAEITPEDFLASKHASFIMSVGAYRAVDAVAITADENAAKPSKSCGCCGGGTAAGASDLRPPSVSISVTWGDDGTGAVNDKIPVGPFFKHEGTVTFAANLLSKITRTLMRKKVRLGAGRGGEGKGKGGEGKNAVAGGGFMSGLFGFSAGGAGHKAKK